MLVGAVDRGQRHPPQPGRPARRRQPDDRRRAPTRLAPRRRGRRPSGDGQIRPTSTPGGTPADAPRATAGAAGRAQPGAGPPPRRVARSLAVALAALVAGAGPAAADPPRPTDYRSTVTAVDARGRRRRRPRSWAATPSSSCGSTRATRSWCRATARSEPYLRFLADGTVERNLRSEATYLNEDRQGAVDLPAQADHEAEPEWETVADDGTYAWHDHRIHWMGTSRAAGRRAGRRRAGLDRAAHRRRRARRGAAASWCWSTGVSPVPWIAPGRGRARPRWSLAARRRPLVPAVAVAVAAAGALRGRLGAVLGGARRVGGNPLLVAVPLVGLRRRRARRGLPRRAPPGRPPRWRAQRRSSVGGSCGSRCCGCRCCRPTFPPASTGR